MSLNLYVHPFDDEAETFSVNITHNLAKMAREAGLYKSMWSSHDKFASDIIVELTAGVCNLACDRDKFIKFNPENGWGTYEELLVVATEFLAACKRMPKGTISAHG
jgi:hypothetical protein